MVILTNVSNCYKKKVLCYSTSGHIPKVLFDILYILHSISACFGINRYISIVNWAQLIYGIRSYCLSCMTIIYVGSMYAKTY